MTIPTGRGTPVMEGFVEEQEAFAGVSEGPALGAAALETPPEPRPTPFLASAPVALPGSVLVVCTGNVVRSPVAALLLRQALSRLSITVESAGLAAMDGQPMSAEMRELLPGPLAQAAEGTVSRVLTREMLRSADLVLTATRKQRAQVVTIVPQALKRTFTLAEFAIWVTALDAELARSAMTGTGPRTVAELVAAIPRVRATRRIEENEFDIADPSGRSRSAYRRTFALLESRSAAVSEAFRHVAERAGTRGLTAPR